MKKIQIEKDEENEIPVKVFEQAIIDISKAMKIISGSRLKRNAIAALIKDASGYPKATINLVMDHLENLEKNFLK